MHALHRGVRGRRVLIAAVLCAALLLPGCGGGGDDRDGRGRQAPSDTTCDGRIDGTAHVTVWFHSGSGGERSTLRRQVGAFNRAQNKVKVELVTLPQGRPYTELVLSAAASGDLPDLLDFDGPYLYNYAWSGKLKPIDSCLSRKLRDDLLPSLRAQGTYAGRMWGVGTFDSGTGLFVRPSALRKAGVRIPEGAADAWTAAELTGILRTLRAAGYETPMDLHMQWIGHQDEWNTYGFAPAVWSAGGDLVDPESFRTANGFLNGPEAVGAFTTLQNWAKEGFVDPDEDGRAFAAGRSPVSWAGHWVYGEYVKAHPGDLAIVPLPDFGHGPSGGMGSWQWGITSGAADGDAVWRFVEYLLRPEQIHRMTESNGAIPATNSAVRLAPRYDEGGAERLFIEQLRDGVARPRPRTPAYPAITAAFSEAVWKIVHDRAPVAETLDEAVETIDKDLAAHDGYPQGGP